LIASLKIVAQDNRIQVSWRHQPTTASSIPSPNREKLRYQVRVRTSKASQQAISFRDDPAKIHIIRQGLDTLALVQRGDWQWQNQGGSTLFLSTTDQSQEHALGFHLAIGRFGLMDLGAQYLPQPQCAFSHTEPPRNCTADELDKQLQRVQIRLASKSHPLPYYSLMPLLQLSIPDLTEPLHLPIQYGEILDMLLPYNTRIDVNRLPDDSSPKLKPVADSSPATAGSPVQIINLQDLREFIDFPIESLLAENQLGDLQLSFRAANADQTLSLHSAKEGQQTKHQKIGPAAIIPLQDKQNSFRLETGHYKLSLFNDYGPICQQTFHATLRSSSNIPICQENKPWHESAKKQRSIANAWAPKPSSKAQQPAIEKPLELVRDSQPADDNTAIVYWFQDPNFNVNLRIEAAKNQADLVEVWQNFIKSKRSPSIFLLKQFLLEHAPAAKLALGCPNHTMSIHDYESLAKALGGFGFEIFGCQNLDYEDQLFQAIDRLQGSRENLLTIKPSHLYLESLATRLAHPSWHHDPNSEKSSSRPSLGAGAAVVIVGSTDTAQASQTQAATSSIDPKIRLTLQVRTDVFSTQFMGPSLRIIALRRDGSSLTIAEHSLTTNPSEAASAIRNISLELPQGTSYLRAEILAQLATTDRRLRLATSQYWTVPLVQNSGTPK